MSFLSTLANVGTWGIYGMAGGGKGDDVGSGFAGNDDLASYGANPYSSPLATSLQNMPGFTPVSAQSVSAPGSTYQAGPAFQYDAYQAKDMSNADLPQYDAMRTRLNSQYSQSQGQAQDAIDRQFAAMGGGPGGAQIKQTENLAANTEKQKGQDLEGIDAQEAQSRQDLQTQENQKAFQSSETGKGYGFQANEADLSRKQTADEAAAGRSMQGEEFNAGQNMSANEFNQQMQQNQNQFGFQAGSTLAGLNTSWDQAQQEAYNNEFNKQISQYQAQHSGGLLGGGGFLGLGI